MCAWKLMYFCLLEMMIGGKRGHPAGLKGREIGLYYARKGMRKNTDRERKDVRKYMYFK